MVHPKVVTVPHTGDTSAHVARLTGLELLDPLAQLYPPTSIDYSSLQNPATLLEIVRAQSQIARFGIDLGVIMALVTEWAQHLTCATGVVVEMVEDDGMVYHAMPGLIKALLGLRLTRQDSLSDLYVQTDEILYCTDSETGPHVNREAHRRVGLCSMVVTPLRHLGTTVGVLELVTLEVDTFSASDIGVLELVSELIASTMFHVINAERDQLYLRTTHDALTDLPNRALLYGHLRQLTHLAQCARGGLGVLSIDMDNLKFINDRRGHRTGDVAIRETVQRMGRTVRRSDTAARVDGDELAVLLPGIGARADAQVQSEQIIGEVQQPHVFEGQPLDLHTNVDIAVMSEDGTETITLLDQVDREMCTVKHLRKQVQPAR